MTRIAEPLAESHFRLSSSNAGHRSMSEWAFMIDDVCEVHGWNDDPHKETREILVAAGRKDLADLLPEAGKTQGDWAILAVSEIVEAFEEFRNRKPLLYLSDNGKPEGIAVEYADCLIRILHWFRRHNLSPDAVLELKFRYNEGRPHRHGDKAV